MKALKLLSFLITLFILLISFFGCSPRKEDKIILTIWHWMTDRQSAFEELARRYEENTGIKINFELYAPSDAYSQKVRSACQGRSLPDIFGILGEKSDFARFVKAGHILNLTPYMEEDNCSWKNKFFAEALAVNEFSYTNKYGIKPGIYAVPIDITTILMLYNKDLFKKIGLDPDNPPQTFEEWLSLGKVIREKNLQGLVSGWSELWLINCFAYAYAFNIMGEEKVFSTIRGEVPYTDSDWIKVFTLFKEIKEAGMLASGIITMINKTAEQVFANEKAVFAFNGSWCVNVYKGMNPDLNYGVML
ncbi:MAG: extracellular solute-binding protein, partial [Candidatus Omnitrophica bacterium]|nr:extracellular solute-binding protein [Candidatus Omnitrophota bacterium]